MIRTLIPFAVVLLAAGGAGAQERPSQAVIDAYLKSTFGKASAEWQARIKPDDSLSVCNTTRNNPSSADSEAMLKRESARVVYPADGKFLGDWKKGYQVANNGRGGQFSDPPGTVAGGNCFACHQLDPKEVSYGTLGPSLAAYGKDRKYDPETIKDAYTKIYNSMAVVPCSNMPRFGVNKVLDEQQIKDVMAYLFDPESPVNK
ncbi:Monoheme cytochrome SoxX (Sulfur oxidation) [Bosea sp. 62]|uniref:sulfur oxidation c-type cytochrome SoxX n=1 Tax=unclassified Bosea (in: a-proteobacteria) TaxID=2653178 RepID=UPI0012525992|nr:MULTISPECIES: sulfur oxidation c-type cytochrome SoxX [unclassified Bosea (in: a-proteobacteria)]CAD5254755.1 Monoheme cytochrome SoxX (Sulfur oxidation) [Bosea sp. 7B]CAD5276170.1 Monoheme cytochrome SoxX (Sulfur oxidation) [Bosea sp. 21B]CAD5277336.1 Monoheme cytochrome SoxX (Sulfur oxidation) [Bosea sp. 46]VVT59910.1 Sulfur-oxidizing protein SoxX [Bosea sp. EC-HK365B]VXB48290.1 Monoheme cytochrome SoxX (Sulfur oxidation) [Bosea sp. 62]